MQEEPLMSAISLPEFDKLSIEDLRQRFSKLSELDLSKIDTPSLERAGKSADQAIDRVLGRSRTPAWPWLATGLGLVVVVGAIAAWFAFLRRPDWRRTSSGIDSQPPIDAIHAAEDDGMTPYTPIETFRTDDLVATMRSNGSALEDS
jgi:hypothetical protein